MERERLITTMVELLQETLDDQGEPQMIEATATSPLIGATTVLTSLALVSLIADVESMLSENHDLEIMLVSEHALSRRHSPFLNIESLADYILELAGVEAGAEVGTDNETASE